MKKIFKVFLLFFIISGAVSSFVIYRFYNVPIDVLYSTFFGVGTIVGAIISYIVNKLK